MNQRCFLTATEPYRQRMTSAGVGAGLCARPSSGDLFPHTKCLTSRHWAGRPRSQHPRRFCGQKCSSAGPGIAATPAAHTTHRPHGIAARLYHAALRANKEWNFEDAGGTPAIPADGRAYGGPPAPASWPAAFRFPCDRQPRADNERRRPGWGACFLRGHVLARPVPLSQVCFSMPPVSCTSGTGGSRGRRT